MAARLGTYAPIAGHESDELPPERPASNLARLGVLGDGDVLASGPPSPGRVGGETDSSAQHQHALTFVNGFALVLGLQIGSGIFTVPSQVSQNVASPPVGVAAWLFAGLLVWTGAASFVELGLAIPRNGGIQEYLRQCYGDFPAFLFSWLWVFVLKPCSMAMISIIFSDNLCRGMLPEDAGRYLIKPIALLGLAAIVLINYSGAKTGAMTANVFLVLKLSAVASISLLGFGYVILGRQEATDEQAPVPRQVEHPSFWQEVGGFVSAVFGALFCYGGWESIGFVAGEMKNPTKDLPRTIHSAMAVVITAFILMVTSLYLVLSFQDMRDTSTPVVDFGLAIFGSLGGSFYSVIAAVCAVGSLHANVFATARVCVAAAQRSYFPKVMHLDEGVTLRVLLCSACPTALFIILGNFNFLVTFYGISLYLFFLLSILGIHQLRKRPSADSVVYRTATAYPVIFCITSGFLALRGIFNSPLQGVGIVGLTAAGFALYRLMFVPSQRDGGLS